MDAAVWLAAVAAGVITRHERRHIQLHEAAAAVPAAEPKAPRWDLVFVALAVLIVGMSAGLGLALATSGSSGSSSSGSGGSDTCELASLATILGVNASDSFAYAMLLQST